MANLNKVMLIGRLTRDPQVRYTPSGAAVADLGLAVNRYWTGQDGQKHEETTFVDVTLWRRQAELAQQYLSKGREVFIEGYLKLDQWDTPEGQKRSKLSVVGEVMQFIGGRGEGGGGARAMDHSEGVPVASQSSQGSPRESFGAAEPPQDEIPF